MSGATTLVVLVDDHDGYRAALADLLERSGRMRVVHSTGSAASVLEFLEGGEAHLVVCDLHLDGMDGTELTRRLLERGVGPPVCMVSADARRSAAVEALGAGAVGFVHKSTDPGEIVELLLAAATGGTALDRATAQLLAGGARGTVAPIGLSTRQLVLLRGLADGLSEEALSERTGMDVAAVRRLTERTMADLGAPTESAAVAWALRNRVIE